MVTTANNIFDYIIIGAGSAGNVLACRLTEDANIRVLLLEAGGPDYRWDFRTQMPAALSYPLRGTLYNWAYVTDPEPNMHNREMDCSRGKGLGGSSLINGMCYIRGNAMDLENWADQPGLTDWRYANCLPYYKKAETRDIGANDYHGNNGPLKVATSPLDDHPLKRAFVKAAVQAGHHETDDLNGFRQEGFGPMDRTVTSFGRRSSTARGYLDLAKSRPNLTIITHALIDKINIEQLRAVGVTYQVRSQTYSAHATREVLLCAGAIGSPTILQRSGVGDPNWLMPLGIKIIHPLTAVGKNLQDHLETYVQFECTQPITLYPALKWYHQPAIGAKWLFLGKGIGASNHFEAGGFLRTDNAQLWPNIQYHFLPIAISYNGKSAINAHGFQAHVGPMRSKSMGRVRLRSRDPQQPPSIFFNYMSHAQDWFEFRRALHLTREIFQQPAMQPFVKREVSPGPNLQSDTELDNFVREKAETAYHPCGSCRMGEGEDAVVDSQGRVHGLTGLRIVDASLMPQIITGNLNATTIMMAEKIADLIRGKTPLPPDFTPFYREKF